MLGFDFLVLLVGHKSFAYRILRTHQRLCILLLKALTAVVRFFAEQSQTEGDSSNQQPPEATEDQARSSASRDALDVQQLNGWCHPSSSVLCSCMRPLEKTPH